jgi:hypothetical protein
MSVSLAPNPVKRTNGTRADEPDTKWHAAGQVGVPRGNSSFVAPDVDGDAFMLITERLDYPLCVCRYVGRIEPDALTHCA